MKLTSQRDASGARVGFEKSRGITHLSVKDGVAHISVPLGDPAGEMHQVFCPLAAGGVNVYLIKIHAGILAFAVDAPFASRASSVLEQAGFRYTVEPDCSLVSTVARSMRDMSGVMCRIMDALHGARVEVREFADSYNSVSCLVRSSDRDRSIAALSGEFGVRVQEPDPSDPW